MRAKQIIAQKRPRPQEFILPAEIFLLSAEIQILPAEIFQKYLRNIAGSR